MTRIFFTSDTHFGHKACLEHDGRPFSSIEEMDSRIIEEWNKQVAKNDIVWHLGDFCFRSDKPAYWYLRRLNGSINLVLGNHDKQGKNCAWRDREKFASCQSDMYMKHNHQKIHLYHYKCHVWRASVHGSIHLFGHSHGCTPKQFMIGKCLDVGIMTKRWPDNGNWLYEFEEICELLKDKSSINHH